MLLMLLPVWGGLINYIDINKITHSCMKKTNIWESIDNSSVEDLPLHLLMWVNFMFV